MILTPRDWQAMAQREASDLLGTPEGAAKLAEAKRYGALADVIKQQHRDIERLREHAIVLAETARQVEREACAEVCEAVHVRPIQGAHEEYLAGKEMAIQQCARAIRVRAATAL